MNISDVVITNWEAPGAAWGDRVKQRPDEPLIEGTFQLTLSWNEYRALLAKSKKGGGE